MAFDPLYVVYLAPLIILWLVISVLRRKGEANSRSVRDAAVAAGLTQPSSLHPVIDPAICLGCGACARACPEGDVIGLIGGKAALIEPTQCIGHGACKLACPYDAISLVFGTEERGVDIPHVGADFQTNIPGIYIAGELGGMGLIRNAIEQGRQALAAIKGSMRPGVGGGDLFDVIIVGAGPAGISASLAAMENKIRFLTLEQDSFGGTVSHFPRGKLVMTQPAILPLYGKVRFREVSKEKLLAFWQDVAERTGLTINYQERVEEIVRQDSAFVVRTTQSAYRTRAVLLAIGRRGTPRKLEVPGEDQSKVVYRLIDPEQYRDQRVLVVGGGDSAMEAAASIAELPGTEVTLSYRSKAFSRAKLKNRERIETLQRSNKLEVMLSSNVRAIEPDRVAIEHEGHDIVIENDAVIVCAGGILPTGFLKATGIEVETKYGTA
ncbi:MAG: NAD(P)-binding domain-containing protein [Hyphomicrobiaceae bacterium]